MDVWFGWIGAVCLGVCMASSDVLASKLWCSAFALGTLMLGVYAVLGADYPVSVLAFVTLLLALMKAWRARERRRRARPMDVTFACDQFERARRALEAVAGKSAP